MPGCGGKIFSETWMSLVVFVVTSTLIWAGSLGDLKPRVPPEHLAEAQSLQNPFVSSVNRAAKGKKLYEGKAWCLACHGLEGVGGTSGGRITPPGGQPPINLTDAAWQAARSDGELFWILKNGGHGTDMAPYMSRYLSEEEVWEIVTYIRTFSDM